MAKLLTEMMGDYFSDMTRRETSRSPMPFDAYQGVGPSDQSLPVKPKNKSGWEIVSSPRRLHKKFEFNSHMHYSSFLNEVLAYETETGHYATLRCEYPSIVIEVYTHDVDAITEVDLDYAKTANEIYEDVLNYSERNDYEF